MVFGSDLIRLQKGWNNTARYLQINDVDEPNHTSSVSATFVQENLSGAQVELAPNSVLAQALDFVGASLEKGMQNG